MTEQILTDKLQFKILAPTLSQVPPLFGYGRVDSRTYENLIFDTQLVRGLALRECGQMGSQLLEDGRHFQQIDLESWHILLQDGEERLLGCARYRPLRGGVEQLGASHSSLARSNRYGPVLKSAIERLIANVRVREKEYGEAGGWALRREIRGSTAAVNIALAAFALAEHLGSGLAITTATRMHRSASILCRIGASKVAEVPAYYEPKYGSILELLHFNLPYVNPRYAAKLQKIRSELLCVPVICARHSAENESVSLKALSAQLAFDAPPKPAYANMRSTIQ